MFVRASGRASGMGLNVTDVASTLLCRQGDDRPFHFYAMRSGTVFMFAVV